MALMDRFLKLRPFRAPWWLRGAHRQTLAAGCWFGQLGQYQATPRNIELDDGDIVVVHDDCPNTWKPGDPAALLMHGLNGSHQSPVLVRLAAKLTHQGTRVFRWDMRGCGAGKGLARLPYHAGRSDDLARVLEHVVEWCQSSGDLSSSEAGILSNKPFLSLLGISLSGNILLKYLGEKPDRIPCAVAKAIAVNPPIDLAHSLGALRRTLTGWYDRHFAGQLFRDLLQRRSQRPDAPMPDCWNRPRTLMDFDDWYTAPVSGFSTSREYYDRSSAIQFLPQIQVPTTIITSKDDPMVPLQMFTRSMERWSPRIRLAVADGGGHVGYIARRGLDPDEFWLDWRILELMAGHSHEFAAAA